MSLGKFLNYVNIKIVKIVLAFNFVINLEKKFFIDPLSLST